MRRSFKKIRGFPEAMLLTLAVTAVLLFVVWQLSTSSVAPATEELQQNLDFVAGELATIKQRLARLQARQVVVEREAEVLRQANRILRETESERQAELGRLQSELDFYRRLAGSGGAQSGLDVYRAEIVPTESRQVFRFILTLTQNIQRASMISGRVRIDIEGTLDNRPVNLRWAQISDGEAPEPAFRFKYFQQLEGYLVLPDGFDPLRISLTLESKNQRKPVVRTFDWANLLDD
jgi:hypothetical protein